MTRELVAIEVRTPVLREYSDEPLRTGQIRVRTQFGAPKHGTELHGYRADTGRDTQHWDPTHRLFMPGPGARPAFPMPLGNIAVGHVTELGPGVEGIAVGDRVAGYGPLRETQTWAWDTSGAYPGVRKMPDGMSWQAAVCLDPATVAMGGVRDGHIRVGDRVAVFGLGAIGLMALQIARIAGASQIIVVDPIARRREVAAATGADLVLDPTPIDAGLEIRRATGMTGVDVSVETSGSGQALHQAIRGVAFGGTVVLTGVYNEFHGGINLGAEAHLNRPTFIFTRAESEPHRDHPHWNNRRQADAAWELLASGRIRCDQVVQPIVPFSEVVEAYREIDEHPERSVKLGVSF